MPKNVHRCWAAVAIGVAVTAYVAVGGPLEPPSGSVAPTGRTLDEIYNAVRDSRGGCGCSWKSAVCDGAASVVVAPPGTKGVVHAVIIWIDEHIKLADAAGVVVLAHVSGGTGAEYSKYELDIEFNNGLQLIKESGGSLRNATVMYRLDP